jgi:predicted small secreted protein
MKKVIFGTALVLGTILTACNTGVKTEDVKSTEDSTKVEVTTVTTPSVDSVKVEETKPEDKK